MLLILSTFGKFSHIANSAAAVTKTPKRLPVINRNTTEYRATPSQAASLIIRTFW